MVTGEIRLFHESQKRKAGETETVCHLTLPTLTKSWGSRLPWRLWVSRQALAAVTGKTLSSIA